MCFPFTCESQYFTRISLIKSISKEDNTLLELLSLRHFSTTTRKSEKLPQANLHSNVNPRRVVTIRLKIQTTIYASRHIARPKMASDSRVRLTIYYTVSKLHSNFNLRRAVDFGFGYLLPQVDTRHCWLANRTNPICHCGRRGVGWRPGHFTAILTHGGLLPLDVSDVSVCPVLQPWYLTAILTYGG